MKKMLLTLPIIALLITGQVLADASGKGYEIAKRANETYNGYGDSQSRLRMLLSNKSGDVAERKLSMSMMEQEGGELSLIVFETPQDVKNTSLLTNSSSGKDKQWLYLPILKRVKRISGAKKSSAFLGSEFSYEDFSSMDVDKYRYEYIQEEVLEGHQVYAVNRYPIDVNSRYQKQIVWYDVDSYLPLKIEFYDQKDWLIKTLTFSDYQAYLNKKIWRAKKMSMKNLVTGKSTTLVLDGIEFNTGLRKGDFHPQRLKVK
ncbi:outer membrane lipoprotein-sorting protein [Vibrio sp. TRT 2004]|uniref:outer membrane lipoprotein-sorting protein n=1 Tax=Vibrio sp. TRT 2004 TaxID=3418506 RepID=UPI003CEFA02D